MAAIAAVWSWAWPWVSGAVAAVLGLALAAHGFLAALTPPPVGSVPLAERLAAFPRTGLPLERPVRIFWNTHQVPYIVAETDRDLAFTLGLVHAHLRGGQLALGKRIVQGRLSEIAGPLANDIDHALRILDLPRAAATSLAAMPPETRAWMRAFVEGLNHYERTVRALPPEYALLGLDPEPWEERDLLALGRLAGLDINWGIFVAYLSEPDPAKRRDLLARLKRAQSGQLAELPRDPLAGAVLGWIDGFARTGSNALAVAPQRSADGAAWLAADPHLGFILPNLWMLVGAKSPSYHMVGLMPPGLPFVAVGRSPEIAWGGTNMRAASSDLYDVSGLDPALIERREVTIPTRFWFDAVREVRWSPFGPLLTDATALGLDRDEMIALKWMGHEPADEVTALLRAARARDVFEFRESFKSFAVSAQNMIAADRQGNIAHVLAVTLPGRAQLANGTLVRDAADPAERWTERFDATTLPWILNPPEGFVASANNWPMPSPVPLGFAFSDDDRVERLRALLAANPRIDREGLIAVQTDTLAPKAARLAVALARLGREAGLDDPYAEELAALARFDGDYRVDAAGPVLFEAVLAALAPGVAAAHGRAGPETGWGAITAFLVADLEALAPETRTALLRDALASGRAAAMRFPTWGDMHRMRVAHALAALPLVGPDLVVETYPTGGSRETPMKAAHGLVSDEHVASFGSQSRAIVSLADLDTNWFALFGGQDGWIGSTTFADQMSLWRERRFIRLPLRLETVAAEFPEVMELAPAR